MRVSIHPTAIIEEGVEIGSIIGNDLVIGRFAMVGMGSLITKLVPDFHLALGHPATSVGCVCRCGHLLLRFAEHGTSECPEVQCTACGLRYAVHNGRVTELRPSMKGEHSSARFFAFGSE